MLDQVPAICPSQAFNIIFKHVSLKKVFDLVNHHISLSQLWFPWELAMFIQFHMFCFAVPHCWEADVLEMQFWKGIRWPWRTDLRFISTCSFSSLYLPALPPVYIYLLFPQFIFTSYFSSCYLPIFSLVYTYLFFLQFIFTYSFPSLYLPVSFPSLYLPVLSPVYIYLLFIQFISPCSFLSLYFYLLFLQFIFTSSSSLYLLTLPPVYIYQSFLQVIFTCFSPNFSGGLPLVQDNSWGQSGEQSHGQRLCSKSEPCRECCSLFMWGICDGSGLKG